MLGGWQDLAEPWERIRWARRNAQYERAKEAADILRIEPNTYRSYERATADAGRIPKIEVMKRIAKQFGVSWVWIADGEGHPEAGVPADDGSRAIVEKVSQLPKDKRADALSAALSVLDSYIKRAS